MRVYVFLILKNILTFMVRMVCLGIEQGSGAWWRGGGGGWYSVANYRIKINHMAFDLAVDMRLNIMRVLNAQVMCVCIRMSVYLSIIY